jgi:acyl-CoA-binding protein
VFNGTTTTSSTTTTTPTTAAAVLLFATFHHGPVCDRDGTVPPCFDAHLAGQYFGAPELTGGEKDKTNLESELYQSIGL